MTQKLHLAHILVRHRYEAEDVERKLKQGETFQSLARKFSLCSSADEGGELGIVERQRLDPDFAEAAEALNPHQISTIVRTRFGYHLILRLS